MAVIARLPLNTVSGPPWQALVQRAGAWAAGQGLPLRDLVLLLPFTQLLPPARAAFASQGGWQPRIETTDTLAAALGPAAAAQPLQLSFELAADRLVAARLLRSQAAGAAWLRRDPRRFDRAVDAVVRTAQEMARAAHALAPSRRESYWAEARAHLAPSAGPGTQQRWLARVALEWAAQCAAPGTDRLFELAPAGWVALQAGGPQPLVEALLAETQRPALVVDADEAAGAAPPARAEPAVLRCAGFEHEAQCAAALVLQHLERGEWPVALIGQDRQIVRRVRALLERQNVPMADETGWALSTTRAAALVMALLRAALPRAGTDALFDWLKSLPPWPEWPEAESMQRELERWCRRHGVSRVERLLRADLAPGLAAYREQLEAVLARLRGGRASVGEWLGRLREALQDCGGLAVLAEDEAGQAVLRALHLAPPPAAAGAWFDAASQSVLGVDGFLSWVDAVLEAASFTPVGPPPEEVRVVITPLGRVMLGPFAAIVCPGADDRHLGAAPPSHPLLSEAEQLVLGLGGRAQRMQREALAFAHALAAPHVSFLRRHADVNGEPLADSPLLQRLELTLAAQGRTLVEQGDPRTVRPLQPQPLNRPFPTAADALPARVSASAVEALRDCPYRFFSRHVLGLREDDELEVELDKRDYGDWLHRVLLRFHQGRPSPPVPPRDAELLHAAALQVQGEAGLSDEQFLPFAASFARFVPCYLAWLHERDAQGAAWLAGERECSILPPAMGGIELHGVIDRIDRVGDGAALELIDYKTSSAERLKRKVKEPLEDTQLAFYAALLAPEAGAPLSACYLPLDEGDTPRPVVHPEVGRSAEVLVRELGGEFARLRAGQALPALGEGEVCERCEARGLCRRDHWPDGVAP
jgi:ATP-dependent helicase/nuclease subunit B